ncbi:MAG: hypothetical protein ACPGQL_09275 [Thermoplasmatota archaeon]
MAPNKLAALADRLDLRQMELDESGGGSCGRGPRWCVEAFVQAVEPGPGLDGPDRDVAQQALAAVRAAMGGLRGKDIGVEMSAEGGILRYMDHTKYKHKAKGSTADREAAVEAWLRVVQGPDGDRLDGYFDLKAAPGSDLGPTADQIRQAWRTGATDRGLVIERKDARIIISTS